MITKKLLLVVACLAIMGCCDSSPASRSLSAEEQQAKEQDEFKESFGIPITAKNIKVVSKKDDDTWLTFELPPLEGEEFFRTRKFLFFHHGYGVYSDSRSNAIVELK